VRKLATLLPVALFGAALLGGCGTGGIASTPGDPSNGAKLFTAKCGGCHSLADAGTSSNIGPNLDAAFGSDKQQGFKESSIKNLVLIQIREPSQPMPSNLVKGQDAIDVASYVAAVAGAKGPEAKAEATASNDGKTIFKSQCASCHTLSDAGTNGTVGPNLDQLQLTLDRVRRQVENGGSVMPAFKGRLTDAQIEAVSKYVASVAGK
jgi:cbb3-type cytochrome c oxidase subunit III